jgi:error-prone DNA polymerase
MQYAELQVTSNFSFLRGASHGEELVVQAKHLGLEAIALTDHNSLAGIVRAHVQAKEAGLRFVVGARLDLSGVDGSESGPAGSRLSLLAWPTDRAAYGQLCRLLTLGQRRAGKGECHLTLADVADHCEGLILALLPPETWPDETFEATLAHVRRTLDGSALHLVAHMLYRDRDRARLSRLASLAARHSTPLIATNAVRYHHPDRKPLLDVLTCIRETCTLGDAGFRLEANAERHLKPAAEMARLFRGHEAAVERTVEIATACRFSLDELKYEYPDEPIPAGTSAQSHLAALTWQGAAERYPQGLPDKVRATVARELVLIDKLGYAPYFLTVHDIVCFARSRDKPILCQGRGSAANSAVCYCLGITAVDPVQIDLLFERFVSEERKEPPDIDVDFEHERREEVIQYIYERYGRERAGLAATVITYRGRSAVRDVGKVMGLSEDVTAALAGIVWGRIAEEMTRARLREIGLDPDDPLLARTLAFADEISGFPRHLSQHVGGFVLTRGRLDETVPIGNAAMQDRTVIEWDKDDIDALGILKVDVLGLGMLSCIRKSFELIEGWYGVTYSLASVPREDEAVYDMLCRADSVGVFQVESRAQMNMLPRLKPRCFYDLVIEVAIVRPGPIQGDMVHPYLRRRQGLEEEEYPAPHPAFGPPDELKAVLGKTKGVPLFQEQAMRLAMVAAEFSPGELNELRKAMATFRRRGVIGQLEEKMVSRMVTRGYEEEFARRCFDQIKGFGEYGFPESHAASFAHLVYVSAWLKCHFPAVFAAALLNSQPMGFYASAQIVRDAREHGVEVRGPDVNVSHWDATLESPTPTIDGEAPALRLGLREVSGLSEADGQTIVTARSYTSLADLQHRAGLAVAAIEKLAGADAFGSLGLGRRQALWQAKALGKARDLPLFAHANAREQGPEAPIALPVMPASEEVVNDYQTIKLSLKGHPMEFLRDICRSHRVTDNRALKHGKDGKRVVVAGVVLVRQRPGSSGVVFITLEDEFAVANIVVWPQVLERFRAAVMGARLLVVKGRVQRSDDIIHVVADTLEDRTDWLLHLMEDRQTMSPPLAHGDPVARPGFDTRQGSRASSRVPVARHPRQVRIMPKSRDFH